MSKSQELAAKAAAKYSNRSGEVEAALDPATILGFVDLILTFVELFKGCGKTPTDAVITSKNPGLFHRLKVRSVVRDNMTRKEWRADGQHIVEAILSTGKEASTADWEALYQEV